VEKETVTYAGSLLEQRVMHPEGAAPLRVVHGRPDDPMGRLIPNGDSEDGNAEALRWFKRAGFLEDRTPASDAGIALRELVERGLICGHIPWSQDVDGRLVLNPGAVSGSLKEDPRALCAVLTWMDWCWPAERRAVPYDTDRLRAAFRRSGYMEEGGVLARLLLLTMETGRNLVGGFFAHFDRLAREAGHDTWSVAPDPVWHWAAAMARR
jgi:diadenosine tetraphosphatase ApaH/serine/threonine PP2A family protein phosphatase